MSATFGKLFEYTVLNKMNIELSDHQFQNIYVHGQRHVPQSF